MITKKNPRKTLKARLIGTIFDIGIASLLACVLIGKLAIPTFYTVITSGWDTYTVMVWGLFPLVVSAALLTAIYNRAKNAYTMSGTGGFG